MSFTENNGAVASLMREIATLTASLQRERQRRAAIAAHAKEVEHRAADIETKLKQAQYANRKLEEELQKERERSGVVEKENIEARLAEEQAQNARLQAQLDSLKSQLQATQHRCQELEQQSASNVSLPSDPPTAPDTDQQQLVDVDAAVQELQAIVPQYKASVAALQGRIAVLSKQLEKAQIENRRLESEASHFRTLAQRNEASFAGTAAKLHSQEAAALAAATCSQEHAARLESEMSKWQQRCEKVSAELETVRSTAQQAQQTVDSQKMLLNTQAETIARLESTVREQQEDIIAALDLVMVCRSSPAPSSAAPPPLSPYSPQRNNQTSNTPMHRNWDTIEANLEFLEQHTAKEPSAATAVGGEEENQEHSCCWSIPAAGGPGVKDADVLDDVNSSPLKNKQAFFASPTKTPKQRHRTGNMAALADDIAALRDALKLVL